MKNTYVPIFFALMCLAPLLAVTGCGERLDFSRVNAPPTDGATEKAENRPPVTEEEAISFGVTLEKSLREDEGMFARVMDWGAISDAVLRDLPENRKEGTYRRKDLLGSLTQSGGVARHISEKVKRGGSYHFLRLKEVADARSGERVLMFRYIDPDGGVDYHHLYLHHGPGNLLAVREIFMFHFSETYTDSIRQTLAPELYVGGMRNYGSNIPAVRMTEVVQIQFRENMQIIQAIFEAYEKSNFQQTLDLFDILPEELRMNKTLQILRLNAAMRHADPNVYLYVMADLRQNMKNDPCVDFLSLDYLFSKGLYTEVLRSMDRIDTIIGRDPYLNLFRCMALVRLGQPEDAKQLYRISVQADPRLKYDPDFSRFEPPAG